MLLFAIFALVAVLFICYYYLRPIRSISQYKQFSKEKKIPKFCNTPYTLPYSGITIPNRIIKAPTTEGLSNNGNPEQRLCNLYKMLANNNIGLIVTGNVMIDARYLERPGNVIFDEHTDLQAVRAWANSCKQARTIVQLGHPGRQANPIVTKELVSASDIGMAGFAKPRPLTLQEIDDVIARFGNAAKIAVDAGFDGVQVHSAHGYLLNQFLSPSSNVRQDKYGGSLENRARLLLEAVASVRRAVGPNRIVAVKLNSSDFSKGGFTHEDSLAVVKMLCEQETVDLIDLSGGNYESLATLGMHETKSEQTKNREAYFRDFARDASKSIASFTKRPAIMLTGGIRTIDTVEHILEQGEADFVGMARPLAIEPTLATELLNGTVTGAANISPTAHYSTTAFNRFKLLFALGETTWYCAQNRRLAENLQPDPDMNMYVAIAQTLFHDIKFALARKFFGK